MWEVAPKEMKKHKIRPPGSYDPSNCHNGVMWGWPRECNMTDNKAKRIIYECYTSGKLTWNQLKNIRKTLSYACELCGGNAKKNWPSLKGLFKDTFDPKTLLPGKVTNSTKPKKIPTAKQLKRAFTKQWSPRTKMPFMKWVVGYVAAYDWAVFGLRSKEGMRRVKLASRHVINVRERWQASQFYGGRCKLAGTKKGTRPWWCYRVCLCPGQKHISPPEGFGHHINKRGNPTVQVRWNTACPIACLEFYTSLLDPKEYRCYPKWLDSGRFGKKSIGDPVERALWWFEAQGELPVEGRFSTNAGRYALARWCEKLNISYAESFEIHGDLYTTWASHYEDYVPKDEHKRRTQSSNPDTATKALGRFANWLGRGKRVKPRLSRLERFHFHDMVYRGQAKLAHRLAHGLPSDDEEEGQRLN